MERLLTFMFWGKRGLTAANKRIDRHLKDNWVIETFKMERRWFRTVIVVLLRHPSFCPCVNCKYTHRGLGEVPTENVPTAEVPPPPAEDTNDEFCG